MATSREPDLASYDRLVVCSSAGKDSQAAMDVVAEAARSASVLDRVVVVHADLGDAEWPGTLELAAEHAAHYGFRFEIVARRRADGQVDTILDRVAARGMWPDAARRWCKWLPILDWPVERVWERIEQAGTRPHPVYAAGMSRLSCRFCVLASKADLVCSARLNPELAARYAAVEEQIGHSFRQGLSMAQIIAATEGPEKPSPQQTALW